MRKTSGIPRLGIAGPVGSGKTALIECISPRLAERGRQLGIITNDIITREDADRLKRTLGPYVHAERILGVETGACPHTAIREDPSMNLEAVRQLEENVPDLDLIILESGGDNLASTYSNELADAFFFVIDVAGGDDVVRKDGPGISQSDLLIINKVDLAPYVGADLESMERDATKSRKDRPFVFTNCKSTAGIDDVVGWIDRNLLA